MMQINTKIRQLSDITVSRIAAGEVIEKPASVVKELVENSIDAGATKIDIIVESAGKNLIVVSDNGCGMAKEDLALSVQRHTTSKLNESDIMDIKNFGFRGEALPSIGSVSRMTISTHDSESGKSWQIYVEGGNIGGVTESSHICGTQIEIRDLFFATPARLKFLRSDRSELSSCIDTVKKIAMAHPDISFSLTSDGKNILKLKASDIDKRITEILGEDFIENSTMARLDHPEIRLHGRISLPTYNRAAAVDQFLFINNRPVKDKILATAVKVAYQDFLARDRHPVLALFLEVDPHLVDVNVHPAKSEVRFHDPNMIRGLLISSIKNSIESGSHKVSSTNADKALANFSLQQPSTGFFRQDFAARDSAVANFRPIQAPSYKDAKPTSEKINFTTTPMSRSEFAHVELPKQTDEKTDYPLGAACTQVHKTYIVSQTPDSLIITDQHAAHERLVYEQLKAQIAKNGILTQRLLIPEIVILPDEKRADAIGSKIKDLAALGLVIERFGEKSVIVREVPSLIGTSDPVKLIQDIADNLLERGENVSLTELSEHITETFACHHSIRSGRIMNIAEMNELLRQMEQTPFSGQCNHGRPTYIELKIKDIEKLFGRR